VAITNRRLYLRWGVAGAVLAAALAVGHPVDSSPEETYAPTH
jgi:hypothetical protein